MEKDKKISDLSNLQEIKVRSSTECATNCGRNDDCFLASFNSITKQCYIGTSVCPVLRTIQTTGWNTIHKTDNCFKTCKGPQPAAYFERFCAGIPNARAYCFTDMELVIKNGVYGNLYCVPGADKLLSLPACGKYVTDILSNLCNGQFDCSVSVGSTTFGTTNCGGGENLYMYYQCAYDDVYCHKLCHTTC
ncbi:uncharacterized protein [Mytilus edulis]|uniref:uncharacterized protein n=1 Tax=Mytilus edulis TaxID=6550 RepID=UPI0039EFF396